MSPSSVAAYCDPLDLLRRFAATPQKARITFESACVMLETNDLSLFPSSISHSLTALDPTLPSCCWKVVRDVDARQKFTEPSIVITGDLMVYSMGPACIIAADRDRKEIVAFIGAEIDSSCFRESILPTLLRLTEFATLPNSASPNWQQESLSSGNECHA
jgi:hypothetical protein